MDFEVVDWFKLAQDRGQWLALLNALMKFRAPQNARPSVTSFVTSSQSYKAVFCFSGAEHSDSTIGLSFSPLLYAPSTLHARHIRDIRRFLSRSVDKWLHCLPKPQAVFNCRRLNLTLSTERSYTPDVYIWKLPNESHSLWAVKLTAFIATILVIE